MQDELNKLTINERRKCIITNILNDTYFYKIHNSIKDNYCEYIYENEELIKYKLEINNKRNIKNIYNELVKYESAVDKCLADQSHYKDIVYWVYSAQQNIEEYCKSKYINGNKDLLDDIVDYYHNTLNTIYNYGGERSGDEDQTLKEQIKILLNNPYLDKDIKNSKEYKEYYKEFINDINCNNDDINYNDKDIEIESSDEEDNDNSYDKTEGSEEDNDNSYNSSDKTECSEEDNDNSYNSSDNNKITIL
jgi:hypothetical protein